MITIFVGDIYESLADTAKEHDPTARLARRSSEIENHKTYYTSLADSGKDEFYQILNKSDNIYYCPPKKWSDFESSNNKSMKFWTEKYLDFFSIYRKKNIYGYQQPIDIPIKYKDHNYLDLEDDRKTDDPQIWIVGCSISHGIGVNEDQKYGYLLSQKLKKKVSWLTHPGSSVQWAKDQILRSDIRKNDIIFWGITSPNRFPYYHKTQLKHINIQSYLEFFDIQKIFSPDKLDDEDQIYQCITSIFQVDSYCRAKKAKLYMLDLFPGTENSVRYYCEILSNFDVVLKNDDVNIDQGFDNKHPGPLQHEIYASKFLKMMEKK